MAPLPPLTPARRAEALQKAAAVRRERAEILASLKDGRLTLKDVLDRDDAVIGKAPARRLLEALPGIGKIRASQLMKDPPHLRPASRPGTRRRPARPRAGTVQHPTVNALESGLPAVGRWPATARSRYRTLRLAMRARCRAALRASTDASPRPDQRADKPMVT